ncbi:hypothetical protein LguiA_028323 [Lonicera macranthoides]
MPKLRIGKAVKHSIPNSVLFALLVIKKSFISISPNAPKDQKTAMKMQLHGGFSLVFTWIH